MTTEPTPSQADGPDVEQAQSLTGDAAAENTAAQMAQDSEFGARKLPGVWSVVVAVLAGSWSLFQMAVADWVLLPSEVVRSVHLAFGIALVYLCFPSVSPTGRLAAWASHIPVLRNLARHDRPPLVDILIGGMAVFCALYYVLFQESIAFRQGEPSTADLIFGTMLIVVLLEAARRALGPALPIIALGFSLIAFGSEWLGPLAWKATSFPQLINKVSIGTEGILGIPLRVSATVVFLFVLFGAMLDKAGAGEWFIRFALSLVGSFRGGAAKAAVLASGLTGIVSGSSIANTVTTGTFTIPLMKRTGYPAVKAGAIEVAASTNGQLMPPIMGAAAFIIAEYCNLSYGAVIMAAAVPAIISYLALLYITHLEACKLGLAGLPKQEKPQVIPTLIAGLPYFPPMIVLVVAMAGMRLTAGKSVLYAILALMVVMLAQGAWRGWRAGSLGRGLAQSGLSIVAGLVSGGRSMTGIAVAVAAAGVIVGVVGLGLDGKIVELIAFLSGGQLWLVLILTAVASLILGLGLPTTANYIVMATLTVPVIVTLGADMGLVVPLIAAHLFCFYFGILADDTPPVGLAAYAASAISRADPIKTGIQGFTYDMRTAILPFAFLFNTELLLIGVDDWVHGAIVVMTGMIAMLAFANATQGWFYHKCAKWERVLFIVVVILLLRPDIASEWRPAFLSWIPTCSRNISLLAGVVLYIAMYAWQRYVAKKALD